MNINDLILINSVKKRVLYSNENITTVINAEGTYIDIEVLNTSFINSGINDGVFEIVEDNNRINPIDMEELSEITRDTFKKHLKCAEEFCNYFGPTYTNIKHKRNSRFIYELKIKHALSCTCFWKIIRTYLQSGFNQYSLVDKRIYQRQREHKYSKKVGRPSLNEVGVGIPINDNEKKKFDDAINYYLSSRKVTITDAYQYLIVKYYSTKDENNIPQILPINMRPTVKQFSNYLNKNHDKYEIKSRKLEEKDFRNNYRLLVSDNLANVNGPMDVVEMDECEFDISLISSYSNLTVGRPILYIMRDVFSRAIVGYYLGFENNSYYGFSNCLRSLIRNNSAFLNKYNLKLDYWPFAYLPNRIRADYGSEYKSKNIDDILFSLSITKDLVPPATGSLKGEVEQFFHQIQSNTRHLIANKGLITKDYDSKHHQDACMTIDEFESIVVRYINYVNNSELVNYKLTKDMVNNLQKITPLALFDYGIKKYGKPRPLDNYFEYYLLQRIKAKVTREGIVYKGLYYFDSNNISLLDYMYESIDKKKDITIKIDPRDISYVYLINHGSECNSISAIPLNPNKNGNLDYAGLTLYEYEIIYSLELQRKRIAQDNNIVKRSLMNNENKQFIKSIKRKKANPKNITDARQIEKIEKRKKDSLIDSVENLTQTTCENNVTANNSGKEKDLAEILKEMRQRYHEI